MSRNLILEVMEITGEVETIQITALIRSAKLKSSDLNIFIEGKPCKVIDLLFHQNLL